MQRNRDRLQLSITGCFSEGIGRVGMVSLIIDSSFMLIEPPSAVSQHLVLTPQPLIPYSSSRSFVSGGLLLVSNLKTRQTHREEKKSIPPPPADHIHRISSPPPPASVYNAPGLVTCEKVSVVFLRNCLTADQRGSCLLQVRPEWRRRNHLNIFPLEST